MLARRMLPLFFRGCHALFALRYRGFVVVLYSPSQVIRQGFYWFVAFGARGFHG